MVILYKANYYLYTVLVIKSPSFLGKYFRINGDTLYFSEGWIPACAGMTERGAGMTDREEKWGYKRRMSFMCTGLPRRDAPRKDRKYFTFSFQGRKEKDGSVMQ